MQLNLESNCSVRKREIVYVYLMGTFAVLYLHGLVVMICVMTV